jgi:hypothetical protein
VAILLSGSPKHHAGTNQSHEARHSHHIASLEMSQKKEGGCSGASKVRGAAPEEYERPAMALSAFLQLNTDSIARHPVSFI